MGQKHAAGIVVEQYFGWIGDRQQCRNLFCGRHAVALEANLPAFYQRANREVEGAVLKQACGFRHADQFINRTADADSVFSGSVVNVHHLRGCAVDGKQIFVLFDEAKHA
ncbi:hypothetical protein D3C76_1172690 [compost metagenome]